MPRTTIRLDDQLFRRLKAKAAASGRTIGALVEDAVRELLSRSEQPRGDIAPLPVFGGSGLMPGIDLESTSSLAEAMEEGVALDALR